MKPINSKITINNEKYVKRGKINVVKVIIRKAT